MNEDRLAGPAKNIGGNVEEGIGRATGDLKTEAEGKAKQVAGDLQDRPRARQWMRRKLFEKAPTKLRTMSARRSSSALIRPWPLRSRQAF